MLVYFQIIEESADSLGPIVLARLEHLPDQRVLLREPLHPELQQLAFDSCLSEHAYVQVLHAVHPPLLRIVQDVVVASPQKEQSVPLVDDVSGGVSEMLWLQSVED